MNVAEPPGTLQDQIYRSLCEDVLAGRFAPGERITLEEISTRFGVSAMPVRDAVRRLAETGTVVLRPKTAIRFAELTRDEFDELMDMRTALETLATRAAAINATDDQIYQLNGLARAADSVLDAANWPDYQARNAAFHTALYAMSRRPLLCKTIANLGLRFGPYIRLWGFDEATAGRDRHFDIVNALRRKDGDVAAALVAADISAGMQAVRRVAFAD